MASYICSYTYGDDGETWTKLFHETTILDACKERKIYFTLIGQLPSDAADGALALAVFNDSGARLTQRFWDVMLSSFRHPYQFGEKHRFIVTFPEQKITLNIYNFLNSNTTRHVILSDPTHLVSFTYKSGTIPTNMTFMSTYKEHTVHSLHDKPGPIVRHPTEDGGYRINVQINGRQRHLEIVR